jgi:hypothetical protein
MVYALCAMHFTWSTQSKLLRMIIPKYLQLLVSGIFLVKKRVTQWIFNPTSRKSDCLTFTRIYFQPIFYRPLPQGIQILLQLFHVVWFVILLYIIQLSAVSIILESMFLQISFTYIRNRSGPKTLPCCTPEVALTFLESPPYSDPLCTTYKELPCPNNYPRIHA